MGEMVDVIVSYVETENVYLDTTVFDGVRLHFDAPVLSQLVELAQNGKIRVFITQITKNEVRSHIREEIASAAAFLKKFRGEAHILKDLSGGAFNSTFAKPDRAALTAEVEASFDALLSDLKATELPIAEVGIDIIFNKYFNSLPPFSEGRKKDEFPDAFVTGAIEKWCEQENEKMYVVSNDSDIVGVCESSDRLISLRKLDELLDQFAFEQRDTATYAVEVLHSLQNNIESAISEDFAELGFILEDEIGDVENPNVIRVDFLNEYVIEASESRATFTIDADVTFEVDVSFGDPNMMYRDSDTRELVYLETYNETVTRTESISVGVEISYDMSQEPEDAELESVTLGDRDIRIFYHDRYPYK